MNIWEKSLIGGLIVAIIGIVSFQFVDWQGRTEEQCRKERAEEREKWQQVVAELEAETVAQAKTPDEQDLSPEEDIGRPVEAPVIGEPDGFFAHGIQLVSDEQPPACADLSTWIEGFFDQLDEQPYVVDLNLENGSKAYFNALVERAGDKPPMVTEMVLNFDIVLQNMIHFYRVLGESNLAAAKQIIDHEEENLETILGVLYAYTTQCGQLDETEIVIPPLETRYEYAGFFLNTIGGRAYLYRRDSRARILFTYYAVLTLHEANQEVLNKYGLDVVPYLEPLADEITARNDLAQKDNYLETLNDLSITYAAARSWGDPR